MLLDYFYLDSRLLQQVKRIGRQLLVLLSLLCSAQAMAQVCAPPTSLLTGPSSGMVNNYYPGNGNLAVGATSLTLGTLDTRGLSTAIAVGDLLMIMQMQDGTFNTSNNNTYGDGSGSGAGSTSVGRAGLYEFVRVTSTGGTIGFTPALANSYVQSAATAGAAQKTYQVIRVSQYSSLTAAGITAPQWNGATGGVVAVDVQNTLTLGSATVEGVANRAFFLAGKGFRGGAGRQISSGGGASTDYATASTLGYNGSKGESFVGTPFYAATLTSNWGFKTTNPPAITIPAGPAAIEGYPGGSYSAGAPGNGGGGGVDGRDPGTGNDENAGGGGGGNHGPGGKGGRPWNDPLKDSGGRGGAGYASTLAFNRVFMGGGGGAGGTNDGTADAAAYTNNGIGCSLGAGACSSGAPGGGTVIIRAKTVTGTGVIDVSGAHGYNVQNDAAGGGGGAGSVILQTLNGGSATVQAPGGDGGNAWAGSTGGAAGRHGPGGAGGGGFIAFAPSSFSLTANVNGGAPGKSMSDITPDDSYGSTGFNGGISTFQPPNVPGTPPAASCDPNLSLAKTDGVTSLVSPTTTSYTFTLSNAGSAPTSGTVSVADKLPAGLSVVAGTLTVGGPSAAAWSCSAANTTDIYCTSTAPIAGSGGTSSFVLSVNVVSANGTAVTNKALVAGGGDPAKTLPASAAAGVTAAAACTANNSPAGCALDTDTVSAPNLSLTKTNGTDTIAVGSTVSYALVVSNQGSVATSGTLRVVDVLPTGLTFSGTSPFTVNSFTCTLTAPNLVCDRTAALAANATATITFTVSVDGTAPSSVLNLAQVGGGGDPAKSTPPTTTTAAACPAPVSPATTSSDPSTGCAADADQVRYVRLQLSKDDGQVFVSQNGTTDYVFVVSNIGNVASAGVISFRDAFTSTMTVSGATGTPFTPAGANGADWSCTRNSTTDVSCTSSVSIAAGGTSSFILTANVGAAAAGTQQNNKARIGGGGDVRTGMITAPTNANTAACVSNGNPLGCATDLNTVQVAPEIRMTKTHPNPQARSPGDSFAFTLTLRNSGGTASTGTVTMVDVVPAGLTIVSSAATAPFTCAVAAQVLTCRNTGGALAAGASRTVTLNVTVAATATNSLVNSAKIGGGGDPQNGTLPTAATAVLCSGTDVPNFGCAADPVPLNTDVQVTKLQRLGTTGTFGSALVGVPVGTTVQYQITVTNNGPSIVTGLTIADTVPTNFSTVSWTCTAAGTASCGTASGTGNAISLTGNINNGAANTLTVLVTAVANTATPIGGVTNTVSVTVPTGINDTVPANDSSSVATAVGVANLSITKSDGVTSVTAGGTTSYTIVATNNGPTAADGARVFDPVSTGLSCTAAPACVATGAATCPAGLTAAQLQNATAPQGVAIPVFGSGGVVTITVTCGVTASGQ
jgi:uncharacterized repeat protein (TIGR01451 family)